MLELDEGWSPARIMLLSGLAAAGGGRDRVRQLVELLADAAPAQADVSCACLAAMVDADRWTVHVMSRWAVGAARAGAQ